MAESVFDILKAGAKIEKYIQERAERQKGGTVIGDR